MMNVEEGRVKMRNVEEGRVSLSDEEGRVRMKRKSKKKRETEGEEGWGGKCIPQGGNRTLIQSNGTALSIFTQLVPNTRYIPSSTV